MSATPAAKLFHCSVREPAVCTRFVGHDIIVQGQNCVTKPYDFHCTCSDNESNGRQDIVKIRTNLKLTV